MNGFVSPLLRRTLALAILGVCVALAWTLAAAPLIGLVRTRQAAIAIASEQLRHLDLLIARRPALERHAAALASRVAAAGGFWHGPSAAVIAAGVQGRLRQVVAASGGRVESSADAGETLDHGFRKLAVRFAIRGPLATVEGTLDAIATASPALFVDRLVIAAPLDARDPAHPPMLDIDLTVSGYMPADAGRAGRS